MPGKAKASVKSQISGYDTQVSYDIGKTKIFITRVFSEDSKETLDEILLRLMKKDLEKS